MLLAKLPANYTKLFPATDLEQVAATAAERSLRLLDPATVNQKYLAVFEAFFEWCLSCGIANENPATGVRIRATSPSSGTERGTFTIEELKLIYGAPLFTGCLSGGRIYEPGEHRVADHRYWLPLLGLFTGARLGELCQLLVADVRQIDGVWCFDITLEGGKNLKTQAARRRVPLHPELQPLGFLSHVEACRLSRQDRLFPEIEFGKGGYLSENPSKWFARFLRKTLSSTVVESRRLVFHSYRHTMKDALRAAGIDERVQDALLGHDLSPFCHPGSNRIRSSFEPCRLGGATGRGAKPPSERSVPSRCIAGSLPRFAPRFSSAAPGPFR